MNGPTCKESVEMMLEYLDGALTDEMLKKLQDHLGGCTPCEEFLASYRATPHLCRKALAKKLPDTVAAKLTEFLRKELKREG